MKFKAEDGSEWEPVKSFEPGGMLKDNYLIQEVVKNSMPEILPGDLIYTIYERKYCVAAVFEDYVQVWNTNNELGCISNYSVKYINRLGVVIWEK